MNSSSAVSEQSTHTPDETREEGAKARRRVMLHGVRAWHVAGVVLLLAVGGLLLYGFWPTLTGQAASEARTPEDADLEAAAQIEAVVVEPVDFPLRAEATGRLAPWRRAELSAEASGRVMERHVEEGQYVAKGTLLLQLDDREARIELQEAETALLEARADYAVTTNGEAGLAAPDTSRLARARGTLRKAEAAFEQGLLSRTELQAARRRFEAAQVLSGEQRDAVQAVVTGVAQAEQRVERARLMLQRTRVEAPFAGRVADLEAEVGQRVAAGQRVLTLLDDRRMKVEVDVLEADLVHLERGATAWVRVPALDDAVLEGRIYAINPSVDAEAGTGRVTVAVSNPEGRLVAGLFAYVELETQRLRDRLVVPTEAVLIRQGRDLVFRVTGGQAQWVYVSVGARSGSHVEIKDGLAPGDTVAVAGHFALAHDAPVAVQSVTPVALTMDE